MSRFLGGGLIFSAPGIVMFALGVLGLAPAEASAFAWMLFWLGLPLTVVALVPSIVLGLDAQQSDIAFAGLAVVLSHVNGCFLFRWYSRPFLESVAISRPQKAVLTAAAFALLPLLVYAPYQSCTRFGGEFGCKLIPPYGWDFAWAVAFDDQRVFHWLLWALEIGVIALLVKYFFERLQRDASGAAP